MRVAVASQNFRTVTPHAGKTRRWIVFEARPGAAPEEVERLDLAKDQALHEVPADAPHPLDAVDAVIAGSCGPGFVRRMARRGVAVATTDAEKDLSPAEAARRLADGELAPRDPDTAEAGHGHGDGHRHGHGHGR